MANLNSALRTAAHISRMGEALHSSILLCIQRGDVATYKKFIDADFKDLELMMKSLKEQLYG